MPTSEKLTHLLNAKANILDNLAPTYGADEAPVINNNENLNKNTFTENDGFLDRNGNKIWGIAEDLTPQEMAFGRDYIFDNYGMPTENRGDRRFYGYKVQPEGQIDPNQEGYTPEGYDPAKFGLSSGKYPSSDRRYQLNEDFDGRPGPRGVDVNKNFMDKNLAFGAATALEAMVNTNQNALDNRVVRRRTDGLYDYKSPTGLKVIDEAEKQELFKSGASEYYVNPTSVFADNYDPSQIDQQKVIDRIHKAMKVVAGDKYEVPLTNTEQQAARFKDLNESTSFLDRISNTVKGVGAMFTKVGIVDPADTFAEGTGLGDLGNKAQKDKGVDDFFGYEPAFVQQAAESVKNDIDILFDKDVPLVDKMRAARRAFMTGLTTPEFLGESGGFLLALLSPGKALSGLGLGAKAAKGLKSIDALVDAGELTKTAAVGEKFKKYASMDGFKHSLAVQSGMLVASAGRVNDQYENFVANNNGNELEGADKAGWMTKAFLVDLFNVNLDKITDVSVLTSPGIIKKLAPAIKELSHKEFTNFGKHIASGLLGTAKNVTKESFQEYAQTSMELFNEKFGAEKFQDLDTFVKFMSDPENYKESSVAAMLGASGSAQFELAGTVLPTAKGALGATSSFLGNTADKFNTRQKDADTLKTEEEIINKKSEYGDLLTRLRNDTIEGKINTDNIASYLDDLDNLNTLKTATATSSPASQAEGEKHYNLIVNELENFVKNNADKKLTKRLTRVSLKEALDKEELTNKEKATKAAEVKREKVQKEIDSLSAEKVTPIQQLASVLTDGEAKTTKTAFTVLNTQFTKGTYKSLVTDEEAVGSYIQAAEKVLVGSSSDNLEDSVKNIKKFVTKNKIDDFAAAIDPEISKQRETVEKTGKVLGSQRLKEDDLDWDISKEKEVEIKEELEKEAAEKELVVEYNDYTRAADVKRILHVLFGKGQLYGDDFENKLRQFAKINNVDEFRYDKIKKTYDTVDEEAIDGSRGYTKRLNRLETLVNSTNPSSKLIRKEYENLLRFSGKLESSVTQLTRGVKDAIAEATRRNKANIPYGKAKEWHTEYKGFDTSKHTYTKPFNIIIGKNPADKSKWYAHVAEAEKRISKKQGYINDIKEELRPIVRRIAAVNPNIIGDVGSFTVPETKYEKQKEHRKEDNRYFKNVYDTLEDLGMPSMINEVILGVKSSDKWKATGDYYQANATSINTAKYQPEDVILLNSLGVFESGKDKKGKPVYLPDILIGKNSNTEKLTQGQLALKAAIDAGSTIVLDSDFSTRRKSATAREARKARRALSLYLTNNGYTSLRGKSHVFVKKTDDNQAKVDKLKEKTDKALAEKKSKEKHKKDLTSLYRGLDLGINPYTGKDLGKDEKQKFESLLNVTKQTVKDESFKNKDLDAVDRWLERINEEEIEGLVAEYLLAGSKAKPLVLKDKGLEVAATKRITAELQSGQVGEQVLKDWKTAVNKFQLQGKDKVNAINDILKDAGVKPREIIRDIFNKENNIAKDKEPVYEYIWQRAKDKKRVSFFKRDPLSDEEQQKKFAKNRSGKPEVIKGAYHIFLGSRKVEQDISKLISVRDTTVLNSMPLKLLPPALKLLTDKLGNDIEKTLQQVTAAELSDQTSDTDDKGNYLKGNYNLYNSPARGLVFNKDKEVNKPVIAAMNLAIGEALVTDMRKLTVGHKTTKEIASMFGLQEFEVTAETRMVANQNGTFLKTLANSIGKDTLRQLGLSERITDTNAKDEYSTLVADVGNTAILLAEKAGILKTTKIESDDLSRIFKNSEERKDNAQTYFVQAVDKKVTVNGRPTREVAEKVEEYKKAYEELVEDFPKAQLNRKEVNFNAPSQEDLGNAVSKMHKDTLGLKVEDSAQETIKNFMKQVHGYDKGVMQDFVDAVDNPKYRIKENMGYVDPNSREYNMMAYAQRENQEAKNADIERQIDEVNKLKVRVEKYNNGDPRFYYGYRYIYNHRYMIDSNTTHPQNGILDRFLNVPLEHKLDFSVFKSKNGGSFEFHVLGKDGKKTIDSDQSFTVRLALAQAFGFGIDKANAATNIELGDALLSLNRDQYTVAKESLLTTGEAVIEIVGDTEVKTVKLKMKHPTHTFQAFKFLESLHSIVDSNQVGTSKITSFLSAEFDSLTSGFANKIQQFPIIKDIINHYARTGVLTKEYQDTLMNLEAFDGAGTAFDPSQGHSTADILHYGQDINFDDSYENSSRKTIQKVLEGDLQKTYLTQGLGKGTSGQKIFESVKGMLPGGDFLLAGKVGSKISDTLRDLFKYPFMIFNYSGGIKSIVGNMSLEVVESLASGIANANFKDPDHAHIKLAAEQLLEAVTVKVPGSPKDTVKSIQELQEVLRNHPLDKITIDSFVVTLDGNTRHEAKTLFSALDNIIKYTYGKAVEQVFEENFQEFIDLQKNLNDLFKVSFRIFDHKRVKMLTEILRSKPNGVLTIEDHAKVLEDLWDDFPWIVGPLTNSKSKKAVKKDVIAIVDRTVKSPDLLDGARNKPQTVLGSESDTATRKVSPLITYLAEAVSAGTVIPFHAIDGAEMSYMVNELAKQGITGLLTIHDATVPPLNKVDDVTFTYNKGMHHTNSDYSLADAFQDLVDRISNTVYKDGFRKEYSKVSNIGLSVRDFKQENITGEKATFPQLTEKVITKANKNLHTIKVARERFYGPNGIFKDAWFGNKIPTPGGMYKKGMKKADLTYKNVFADKYKHRKVNVISDTATQTKAANDIMSQIDDVVTRESSKHGFNDFLPKFINKFGSYQDLALETDETNVDVFYLVDDVNFTLKKKPNMNNKLKALLTDIVDELTNLHNNAQTQGGPSAKNIGGQKC